MNKRLLIIIFIVCHHSTSSCIEPISTALVTIGKIAGVVGTVGGAGYAGHRLTRNKAKQNISRLIPDMTENQRTNDDQNRKKILKKNGHAFNAEINQQIEAFLKLHDTPIPTTYRNITGLIIGQNLNRQDRRRLIDILRESRQKPMATLWLYRALKGINGQKVIEKIADQ